MVQRSEETWKQSAIWWQRMLWFVGFAALLYVVLVVLIVVMERRFIFLPSRYDPAAFVPPTPAPESRYPELEDVWLTASDGTRIHSWFCRPAVAEPGGGHVPIETDMTLLWLHGNAGHIAARYDIIDLFTRIPVNVLIIDYRGYGRSEGQPTEAGVYLDAAAAWRYLTEDCGITGDRIVIFGKSLGGGPATELASKVEAAGLILQSTFTSIPDLANACYPFIPKFVVRSRMSSIDKIGTIDYPKMIIHSPADEIIPYRMGRRLFDAASEPKTFYKVPDAGHNDTFTVGGVAYVAAVRAFIEGCTPE